MIIKNIVMHLNFDVLQFICSFCTLRDQIHMMQTCRVAYQFNVQINEPIDYALIQYHSRYALFTNIKSKIPILQSWDHLRVLKLNVCLRKAIPWPSQLTSLTLRTVITLKYEFPDTLQYLKISKHNKPLTIKFPDHLQQLILQGNFNQPFTFGLPSSLRSLTLNRYSHVLNLPSRLKRLTMGRYMHSFHAFPDSLKVLKLWTYDLPFQCALPQKLKQLNLFSYRHALQFPASLIKLSLGNYHAPIVQLPSTLKYLSLSNYRHSLEHVLPQLRHLSLNYYHLPIDYHLPDSIVRLEMQYYDEQFTCAWPASLKWLILGYYIFPICVPWPKSLKYLIIRGNRYVKSIDGLTVRSK